MINAFVDIAKDPYIVKLNVNAWTYNMVSFLLRTGKGAQTFYFIRQPILVEMANEVLKTKGKYGIDRTKTPSQLEKEAIEKVLDKYDPTKKLRKKYEYINRKNKTKASEYQDLFRTYINDEGEVTSRTRQLLKINPEDSKNFNEEQVRIYYAWLALKPYADDLANLVKFSKIDTKKTGKTFAEQDIYYKGMLDMEENSKFAEGEVTRFFNETFIRTKTENSIPLGSSIFRNLLLRNTDQFANQKHIALSLVGRATNADSKLLSAVINGMEAQIKSQFFNQYIKDNNIDLNTMFQGRNSIPNRLYRFKQEVLKGNPRLSHLLNNDGTIANDFVNYLIPNINKNGLDFIDRSEQLNADQAQANNLINYWRQLLDDPEPSVKRLFRDLAVYSFYTSGDNTVMNAFFQYLPNSERISMGYTQFVQGKLDQMVNNADKSYNDIEDLFLNNWQNDKLVRPVDMYGGKYQAPLRSVSLNKDAAMPNIIFGQRTDMQAAVIKPLNWVTIDNIKYPIFPPYVKIKDSLGFEPANWHVYRLIGYIDKPERTWQGKLTGRTLYTPIYGLISKKGYSYKGHTIIEYGLSTQFEFNKENEWDYFEALNNLDALSDMTDEVERTYFEQDKAYMHHIGELPSYSGMNYAIAEQDRIFEYEQDEVDDSVEGVVLEEADENDTENAVTTDFNEVSPKIFDLIKWYTNIDKNWVEIGTPTLTPNFAGIGTRNINQNGIKAIRDVYENTFREDETRMSAVNIYYGTNENPQLSNFAIRPFNFNIEQDDRTTRTVRFNSVEQGFHYMKAITAGRYDIAEDILNTNDPKQAKYLTSQRNLSMTQNQLEQWNSISKSVMLNLMLDSFEQNPSAADLLLSTGNIKLTHMRNGIEQDNGRFSEVITMVRDIIREDMPNSTKSTVKELTGIDLLALYDQGNKRISEVLDTLEDLTADERQTYLNEFAQQMTRDNVNTQDKLEEALRKFICNL